MRLLKKARKLGRIVANPFYLGCLRKGAAAATEHETVLSGLDFATVIDVGANRGQLAIVARHHFPQARIFCFEPLEAPRATLRRVFAGDDRLEIFDCALGDVSGTRPIHISKRDDSSSLLPIGELQSQVFPGTEEIGTADVRVRRLDEALENHRLDAPVLCKIDVQGFELQVLRGLGALASAIDCLLVEVSFVEFYTGQALFGEIFGHLEVVGLRLEKIYGVDTGANGIVLQGNCFFQRPAANAS